MIFLDSSYIRFNTKNDEYNHLSRVFKESVNFYFFFLFFQTVIFSNNP